MTSKVGGKVTASLQDFQLHRGIGRSQARDMFNTTLQSKGVKVKHNPSESHAVGTGDRSPQGLIAELDPILRPRSLAVVGASSSPRKFGRLFTQAFLDMGFERLYPVNPRETEVLGLKAYPRVSEIPDQVDLAFVVTPINTVLSVVEDCGAKGVKGIVVYASGFAEQGPEGEALQRKVVSVAHQHGCRIIGPNCMGIYAPQSKLSFFPGLPKQAGSIGLVSHSGSLSTLLIRYAESKGLYFNMAISCGNEADLNAADFLEWFGADPNLKVILAYLEGLKEGRRFFELAKEIARRKPIIVAKGGMTAEGAKAANSHTGAMAGSEAIWKALFKQTGVIGVDTIEEMIDTLIAFCRVPLPRGPRVAIVSGPGGPAVLAADACVKEGLQLAELASETKEELAKVIPSVGTSVKNPVDLGMGVAMMPSMYGAAIEVLATDPGVDAVLALGAGDRTLADILVNAYRKTGLPMAVTCLLPPERSPEGYLHLAENGIAAYPEARRAAAALVKLLRQGSAATRLGPRD